MFWEGPWFVTNSPFTNHNVFSLSFWHPKSAKLDSMLESSTTVDSRSWEARSTHPALRSSWKQVETSLDSSKIFFFFLYRYIYICIYIYIYINVCIYAYMVLVITGPKFAIPPQTYECCATSSTASDTMSIAWDILTPFTHSLAAALYKACSWRAFRYRLESGPFGRSLTSWSLFGASSGHYLNFGLDLNCLIRILT